ncbi:MAG: hypothetical protein ACTSRP_20675 [Candidatus Helarchaeota archaeon]
MKNRKIFSILIIISFFVSITFITQNNIDDSIKLKNNFGNEVNTLRTSTITNELETIFTWISPSNIIYNNSKESLSLNAFVRNLTDFDPINSTSYTALDKINVILKPSNGSWSHVRDFENDAPLPSTNISVICDEPGEMEIPYDTTVFFARNQSIYNIKAYWEHEINALSYLDTNLYLFNQSQFHDFENYIQPWRWGPSIETVANFNSSHTTDDWLYGYFNRIQNPSLSSKYINHTINFTITFNKTGWYYLVLWGENDNGNDKPIYATYGNLLTEGPANVNITVNDLMDIYRPALGKVNGFIDQPMKVYERVVEGKDDTYGDSLALIYIFEYSDRKLKDGAGIKAEYDWVPYIIYIRSNFVGEFPNRIICYFDDTWADDEDRYLHIIDPNFSLGAGIYNYKINITAELAPFLNETINMNATVSTTPITSNNRIGSSIRLATTTNSHGFEIKPYNKDLGTTFKWHDIPKYPLNNSALRILYNNTFNEFLENGTWGSFSSLFYPAKTPFTLYFNSLFTAPYLVSGLENILLVKDYVRDWINTIDQKNPYFNSNLAIQINTTVDIPVNFSITYPDIEPLVGQKCNFTLALGTMGNPNITIDYLIDYNMSFSMGLFTGTYNITKNDTIHFQIPLQEINLFLTYVGIEDGLSGLFSRYLQQSINACLNQSKVADYISIENFTLGSHVVGNIVTCNITIHLWPILKDLIKKFKPDWYIACEIIDSIILNENSGLDLILTPQLQGVIEGIIIGDGLEFSNGGQFKFNDTQKSITLEVNRTQDFSATTIQLQSLLYYLNFHIDWSFEVNFNDLPHYFGLEDLHWELGTYPTIDFAQNPMNDSEIISLEWEECSEELSEEPSPKPSPEPSSSISSYNILFLIGILGAISIILIKKRYK